MNKKINWKIIDEIIERLGSPVLMEPPDLTFYEFKFDKNPSDKRVNLKTGDDTD